jgi:phosphatidylglycerol:prolipoprotein diacylglycerol transferase
MLHDLSPFAIRFTESFGIRWYGLSYLAGFFCAYLFIIWLSRRQRLGLTVQMVGDLVTYGAIGILLGGRLGYCLFYSPDLFLKFKTDFPFWGVLALNEGGMSSHGGMIGLVLSLVLFSWNSGISQLYLFDLAAISGPIGVFFGRLANYVNGELVGREVDVSYEYAVKFPQDILYWPQYNMEKLGSLGDVMDKIPGVGKSEWLSWVDQFRSNPNIQAKMNFALSQVLEQIQSGNQAVKEAIIPLLTARHPSQIYEAFGEGLFLFILLFIIWYKPRQPGVVGSWFLILYAIARIIGERFRLPDAHLGFDFLELTRGQVLSGVMLILGLWLLFFYSRRMTIAQPGWGLGQHVRIHRRS